MAHRRIGALAALAALLAAPAAASVSATDSDTKTVAFRLANTSGQMIAEMNFAPVPVGTIVPPVIGIAPDGTPIEGSPVTPLETTSSGIDLTTAIAWLREDPADPDLDRLDLFFGYEPDPNYDFQPGSMPFRPLVDDQGEGIGRFAPDGVLDFTLNLGRDVDVSLLQPATDGLTLSLLDLDSPGPDPGTDPGPGPGPGPDPGTSIPEPSALLLWSAIGAGGLALARRRGLRRAADRMAAPA